MYARFSYIKGSPSGVEKGIENFTTNAVPALQKLAGFSGATLAVDRESGEAVAVSYWRDEAAMKASEDAATSIREEGASALGGAPQEVERYEATVQHRVQPPRADTFARLSTVKGGKPENLDEAIRNFNDEVIPGLQGQPGFRASLLFVDRASGNIVAVSIWDSREAMEASAEAVKPLREKAAKTMETTDVTVKSYEIVYSEVAVRVAS